VARAGRLLNVLPSERRLAFRLLAVMVSVWAGLAVGGNGIEGLLFARVGPNTLPYLYVALGLAAAGVMLGMNAVLARPRPQRPLLLMFPGAALAVVALRALLELRQGWVYSLAWLAMMVLWTGANIVTWGIAGAVHDTRQAKRLFPLYAAGVILGNALGGLATAPLARWIGAENLVAVWALTLAGAFWSARSVLRDSGAATAPRRPRRRTRVGARFAAGVHAVGASPLLKLMTASIVLFAVLYFSLALLFAQGAAARFPDADGLAGFLGLFMGVTSATALTTSLFAANRLSVRFGLGPMILGLGVIYMAGFALLLGSRAFAPLAGFRFVQMVWMNGVWAGAWQALYNVVPPDRREGTRALVDGAAYQGGVVLAGLVLIVAERMAQPRVVVLLGLVLGGVTALIAIRLRRAYAHAVMAALRAGNPDVFLAEPEPLAGVGRDAQAMSAVEEAATDRDPAVRRMAVAILGEAGGGSTRPVLERALADADAVVRASAVRGLARLEQRSTTEPADSTAATPPDSVPATALLHDRDASVRLAAVEVLPVANGVGRGAVLRPLLADPDVRIRAAAAGRLLATDASADAEAALLAMASSQEANERAAALRVWAPTGAGTEVAASAVADPEPVVRRAAVSALAGQATDMALGALVSALGDSDPAIRAEAIDGLVRSGPTAVPALLEAAGRAELRAGAMQALVRLNALEHSALDAYVKNEISIAVRHAASMRALVRETDPRVDLVTSSLRHAARRHAVAALLAASPSWDARAIDSVRLAIDNLDARDAAQRANALEMLDAVGEPEVVRPLMTVWEEQVDAPRARRAVLVELMRQPDPWLRACAAFAAPVEPELQPIVRELAESDPDTLVRSAAAAASRREGTLETLSSLSLMDRIVFLGRVSLFADLAPDDLKHVAEIATEHAFSDGVLLAEQGEPGDEMHVVLSGEISVLVERDGASPIEVARRAAGECVGEMAIVSRGARMASLEARGEVRTLAIDRGRFERILRERPETSLAVMGVLCDRLRELHGAEPPEARA
jgi:HEAT repeat protein